MVWKYGLDKSVLKGTMAQVVTDLTGFRTTSFAGGGFDWCWTLCANSLSLLKYRYLLYWFYLDFSGFSPSQPLGLFYDIAEFFSRGFAKWQEGHERRKEERFVKQEKSSSKS